MTSGFLPIFTNLPDEPELLKRELLTTLTSSAFAVNCREISIYEDTELNTGGLYFNTNNRQKQRPVFRTVVDFGTLPNATTKSVEHNIPFTSDFVVTRVYAAATDPVGLLYVPIPFVNTTAPRINITLEVNGTQVTIDTGNQDRTNFTKVTVVIEYTKF